MRIAFQTLLLCLIMSWLIGCGPTITHNAVSFTFFGDLAELAAYQTLVAAFEEAHPELDIQIRHLPSQGEYFQRLAADFSSGAPADVMLLNYRRFATFAAENALEPLGPYLAQSTAIQPSDFFTPTLAAFQFTGQLWCIPQNVSSLVAYYNVDLFKVAGIPLPTNGWTYAEFLAAARTLTHDLDGDGRIDQYGVGIAPNLFRLAPFIWQAGGELVDDPIHPTRLTLDSPLALRAFQWFVDLQVREQVVPDAEAEAAESSESRFLNGRLAIFFNSRRGVPTYRTIQTFTWDVAPLPQGEQVANILHSDAYCLAAASQQKAAAWTFIEFANLPEGQRVLASAGRTVPSLVEVAESVAFLNPDQPPANSQIFIDAIPTLRAVPIMSTWPAIEEAASKEIERAFYGQVTVEEAARTAVALTQPYFERNTMVEQ